MRSWLFRDTINAPYIVINIIAKSVEAIVDLRSFIPLTVCWLSIFKYTVS